MSFLVKFAGSVLARAALLPGRAVLGRNHRWGRGGGDKGNGN